MEDGWRQDEMGGRLSDDNFEQDKPSSQVGSSGTSASSTNYTTLSAYLSAKRVYMKERRNQTLGNGVHQHVFTYFQVNDIQSTRHNHLTVLKVGTLVVLGHLK